jgi:hypothetical protein
MRSTTATATGLALALGLAPKAGATVGTKDPGGRGGER